MASTQVDLRVGGATFTMVIFFVAVAFLCYGIYLRVKLWRIGTKITGEKRTIKNVCFGIKNTIINTVFQKRIFNYKSNGVIHIMLFLVVCFSSFGFLGIIAIAYYFIRRYIVKPTRLDNKLDDGITLGLIFLVLISSFIRESARLALVPEAYTIYNFAENWVSQFFVNGFNTQQNIMIYKVCYWINYCSTMAIIAYLPFSKMFHFIIGPVNIFLHKDKTIGTLEPLDFTNEDVKNFGKNEIADFSRKELFESDVCVRCGRCQDNCPASLSGKHLSPKQNIQSIKTQMRKSLFDKSAKNTPIMGSIISEEDLWACSTCGACENQCPMFIEHINKTVGLRRHLVIDEARFPKEAKTTFCEMEKSGNPWGINKSSRTEFFNSLDIKTLKENPDAEILFWSGCSGSYDARYQKVTEAFVKLMKQANVNFAVLGTDEGCCGDSARKLGNEYLYEKLATKNIQALNSYNIKKIVTHCPHCFNTIKNDYPQLGGEFEVVHHSEFLDELMRSGKLKLDNKNTGKVTFHDSCYLGRYNNIYDQPRNLIKSTGMELIEMKRNRSTSFCCGAGGGLMWLDEKEGEHVYRMRTNEALETNSEYIATACPFCLTMFEDGVGDSGVANLVQVIDIAELLLL